MAFPPTKFSFRQDGTFRIMQLTDTHHITGDERSARGLDNVKRMLDLEKPDLVIHTGDIIFGKPAADCLREILTPIAERNIPFAVTLGNHDEEFGLTRREVLDVIRTIPGNINTLPPAINGVSNGVVSIQSADNQTQWVLYLLDTGRDSGNIGIDGYGYLHWDQIEWYRQHSMTFRKNNGGEPVPSLAFMHIPLCEYIDALREKEPKIIGNQQEAPCPSALNSGFFVQMMEQGDIKAVIAGHEHDNDYVQTYHGKRLIYGRYSGGDTVYNNLGQNGCRMFLMKEGSPECQTWIRLFDGTREQEVTF